MNEFVPNPNDLNIGELLENVWAHQIAHPSHGVNCIHMDKYIGQLKKATRMSQKFIDLYMQDESGEKNVQAMEDRTQWIFSLAMQNRGSYRRTNQCFCCSCVDNYRDPFCRNHGFMQERPCSEHHSPGGLDDDKYPLASVQEKRASYGKSASNV